MSQRASTYSHVITHDMAVPNLPRQAVVARIACLATLPQLVATQDHKQKVIEREGPETFAKLFHPLDLRRRRWWVPSMTPLLAKT